MKEEKRQTETETCLDGGMRGKVKEAQQKRKEEGKYEPVALIYGVQKPKTISKTKNKSTMKSSSGTLTWSNAKTNKQRTQKEEENKREDK
jgi:hypothetical protein